MGDAEAFVGFYRETYSSVVAQLFAYSGDLGEAQDAAQEAYVRAWLRWREISAYEDARGWVSRVAYNLLVSRWRRARTAAASWARLGSAAPPEPDVGMADAVRALKRLPEPQRHALVLYHLGGFSVNDIATLLGAPEGTIKARLARGRQALARMLALNDTTEVRP